MRRTARLVSVCAVAAALASCGGGSDRVADAPTTTLGELGSTTTEVSGPTGTTDPSAPVTTDDPAGPAATDASGSVVTTTVPAGSSSGATTSTATGGSTASSVATSSSVSSSVKPSTSSSVKPSTSSSVAPSTTAKPTATTAGSPGSKSFDAYADSGSPKTFTVAKGTEVTITVHSSMVHEFHLHGYDLLNSGTLVSFSFTADMTGSFIVENHDNSALICTLVVT